MGENHRPQGKERHVRDFHIDEDPDKDRDGGAVIMVILIAVSAMGIHDFPADQVEALETAESPQRAGGLREQFEACLKNFGIAVSERKRDRSAKTS